MEKRQKGASPHSPRSHKRDKEKEPERRHDVVDSEKNERRIELNALKDCPVLFVTVYNDRAEVTRGVKVHFQAGVNEVTISGLSDQVDLESVRVAGGRGRATILEVSNNETYAKPKPEDKLQKEKDRLEELTTRIDFNLMEIGRIKDQKTWLDGWTPHLLEPGSATTEPEVFSPENFEKTTKLLQFYSSQLVALDEKENKLSSLNRELEKEKIGLEKEIHSRTGHLNTSLYEVVISFQATAPTECEFQVSYITFGTGWEAFYDVRVISQEKEAEKIGAYLLWKYFELFWGGLGRCGIDTFHGYPLSSRKTSSFDCKMG